MGSAITVSMSPLPVYVPPASLTSSSLRTVADVVLGRVVVPPVYLTKPGTVKVHRDGWFFGRVTYPVNAPLVRQHGRDPIFPSPLKPPELPQASIVWQGAIVGTLVALFQDGTHDATEGSPGGMVVDPGRRTRRPDEDLHRVGVLGVVVAVSYVPIFGQYLNEGQNVRSQEVRIVHQIGQDGDSFPKSLFRGRYAWVDLIYRERHLCCLSLDPSTTRYHHLTDRHAAPGILCSGRREDQRSVVRSAWVKVSRDVLCYVLRVPPDAGEDIGRPCILEKQPHEVQARLSDHDAAFVQGTFVFIEDG